MIGAAGIMFQQEKNQYFSTSVKQIDKLLGWHNQHPDFAESINAMGEFEQVLTDEDLKKRLPPEAWEFIETFKKKKIMELPPHRKYDHKIDLEDGANASLGHCPLYAMSPFKLQKVKEYLEEMLDKGFISPSKASYALSILFA